VFIALVTFIAYAPALRGGFVFDDYNLIVENPLVKANDGLRRFWFTTQAPDYYPLTWSLWWAEWRLWGDKPMGYHVLNVLLHTLNAVLIWFVLRKLAIPGAWWVAVVFAVHPVNVATVAWISEQKNTLSMAFLMFAVLLYLRFETERRSNWYGLSLLAYLLALLSKSAVVMLPVVLLGCVWWSRGRLKWKDCVHLAPYFVLSLGMACVTIWFQGHNVLNNEPPRAASLANRLAMAGSVPWFYLYKAILPVNLMMVYPQWDIVTSRWVSYLPGVMLAGGLLVLWWNRGTWGKPWLVGLGYFAVMLFPVSGFFDQAFYRFSPVADHWQYYAIVGIIALAVVGLEGLCSHWGERGRQGATVVGVIVLALLVASTWKRARVYADDVTLWQDNVARNPSPWPYNNLGCAFQRVGRFDDAVKELNQALQLRPDYPEVQCNLGNVLSEVGRVDEAMAHWEKAVQLKPDYARAHYNLGLGLAQSGRLPEAISHWEQAVQFNPNYAEAHYNLGIALEQSGEVTGAIRHYKIALECKPDYAKARKRLAAISGSVPLHE